MAGFFVLGPIETCRFSWTQRKCRTVADMNDTSDISYHPVYCVSKQVEESLCKTFHANQRSPMEPVFIDSSITEPHGMWNSIWSSADGRCPGKAVFAGIMEDFSGTAHVTNIAMCQKLLNKSEVS